MHLLKTTGLLLSIMLSVFATTYAQTGNMAQDVFDLVNKHRVGRGLPALKYNDNIASESAKHCSNMASGKVDFGHDGFEERVDRLTAKIKNIQGASENVAYGSRTAERVVDMWLHSPGHRKNIEGSFTTTGIGIATAKDGTLYFTQIFIKE